MSLEDDYVSLEDSYMIGDDRQPHPQRLNQILCDRCIFFTGEDNLKCAVHPSKASKKEAIGCADFQSGKRRDRRLVAENNQQRGRGFVAENNRISNRQRHQSR